MACLGIRCRRFPGCSSARELGVVTLSASRRPVGHSHASAGRRGNSIARVARRPSSSREDAVRPAAMVDAFQPLVDAPSGLCRVSFIGGASIARPSVLNAPALVESAHMRHLLLKEPGIRATLKLAERTTVALMCVGAPDDSTIRDLGTLTRRDFLELRANGAVGDIEDANREFLQNNRRNYDPPSYVREACKEPAKAQIWGLHRNGKAA